MPLRSIYNAVDWPVILLLGAMLPVADAMATTGAADMIARVFLDNVAQGHAIVGLVVILLVTMFLSDMMNNAATAAVMCPIAISTANHLGVNADAFLMAVAVGASCAFLTPIGHQNNTLILGPGGIPLWRLLAHGSVAGSHRGRGQRADDSVGVAAWMTCPSHGKSQDKPRRGSGSTQARTDPG